MLGNMVRLPMRLLLVVILAIASSSLTLAQDATRVLEPGVSVAGVLDGSTYALVYTYNASAGDSISLTASSPSGLALALLLTDNQGETLAQAADVNGVGSVTVSGVTLSQDGTYYVTVFRAPGAPLAEGTFDLSLVVEAGTPTTADATPVATTPVAPSTDTAVYRPPGQVLTTTGMQIILTWNTTADLNLQVRTPTGGDLYWDSRSTADGGAFGADANGLCELLTTTPVEQAQWPAGPVSTGSYEILVFYRQACELPEPVDFTVTITVDGNALPPISGTLLPPADGQDSVFVTNFRIADDGTTTAGNGGVYTGTLDTPLASLPQPQPLQFDVPVHGAITSEQPYLTYSFTVDDSQLISLSMNATAGNLDTSLFLLGPDGSVVDFNDDTTGTINSAISNLRLLQTGQYTVVATRYGQTLGGTEGEFELLLTGQVSTLPEEIQSLNLPSGDIEVTLYWNNGADLQLLIRDSAGNSVYDDQPSVASGGRMVSFGNIGCNHTQATPVSYIYWPEGFLRAGSYEYEIWYQDDCGDTTPVDAFLNISVRGELVVSQRIRPLPGQKYIGNFLINIDGTVVPGQSGFDGGSEIIDYQPFVDTATPIISGQTVTGAIRTNKPFDLYVFNGQVGDIVSIGMQNTGGTLDPKLFLIGPNGFEIAVNDDEIPGQNANALINQVTLPQDGQYIIIATRFGVQYGGTEGTYSLTLQQN